MSVTVDANILLYATDTSSERHDRAGQLLRELIAGPTLLYVVWPVIMAFLRIGTHPSVFARPLAPAQARDNVSSLLDQPLVRTTGEAPGFWQEFERVAATHVVRGNLVTDAHVAALMRQHQVPLIWTADRDFRAFAGITSPDPSGECGGLAFGA